MATDRGAARGATCEQVVHEMSAKGITLLTGNPKEVTEEAGAAYKNVPGRGFWAARLPRGGTTATEPGFCCPTPLLFSLFPPPDLARE